MKRSIVRSVAAAGALVLLPGAWFGAAAPARAAIAHPDVASAVPSASTPHAEDDDTVPNAAVHAFAQVGGVMYAGGRFRVVRDPARTMTYERYHLFSFAVNTGAVSAWRPVVNGGEVLALAATSTHLYVGGSFTSADGVGRRLVRYSLTTGLIDTTYTPQLGSGHVMDLEVVGSRLFVSGSFPRRLVALDLSTGADTGYLDVQVSDLLAPNTGPVRVTRFAVSPDRTKLVAVGSFARVDGESRPRAFLLDLLPEGDSLSPWYYSYLRYTCLYPDMIAYLRDVDFSPDGSYFVIAATGGPSARPYRDLCDAAARFETDVLAPSRPTWINYTGGDTLLSVAVTGAAVYLGGHQKYMNAAPGWIDWCLSPCVERPGIAAVDPVSGLALAWNPTKTRGVGARVIYPTATGVWFGSDGRSFGGKVHDSIAFTPLPATPVRTGAARS